jgi:nucleotide-binding universal stress UspA family protein
MPVELRRVVIATDFSDRSVHAARLAALHIAGDAEVVLVHVVAIPELPEFIRSRFPRLRSVEESAVAGAIRRLSEVAGTLRAPCARTEVRVGNVAEQITAVARESRADLIVVGRHGDRPGVFHRIGTTADRVVRIAPVPVLLATSMRDARPRRILAALDDADVTPRVVEWSRYFARRFEADVTGLHVVTSPSFSHVALHAGTDGGVEEPSPRAIRERLANEAITWIRNELGPGADSKSISAEVGFGWPANQIVAMAEQKNAELIVIGRAGSGLGGRPLLGTVTHQVLRGALCPVFVVVEPEPMWSAEASLV